MDKLEARIMKAVGRARLIWAIMMATATTALLSYLPVWFVVFLIPFAVMSYFATLFITFLVMRESVTAADMHLHEQEEKVKAIHARMADGGVDEIELLDMLQAAEMASLTPVREMSDEIVGFINGSTMHEWVEMMDPTTGKVERFAYFSIAAFDRHGIPLLPEEKGKVYAHVNGVVYARDLQPA